jgi:hypothetical protein
MLQALAQVYSSDLNLQEDERAWVVDFSRHFSTQVKKTIDSKEKVSIEAFFRIALPVVFAYCNDGTPAKSIVQNKILDKIHIEWQQKS